MKISVERTISVGKFETEDQRKFTYQMFALLARLEAGEELAYYCEADETIAKRFSVKHLLKAWLRSKGEK